VDGRRRTGDYSLIAWLKFSLGVDFIGRTTRRVDGRRRRRRLARNDWLILWKRNAIPSPWLSPLQWAGLPPELTLRAVKGRCSVKGFRVHQITVVIMLLDPQLYPVPEILQAYGRRWWLEICLDDLKTSIKMEFLRARSPLKAGAYVSAIPPKGLRRRSSSEMQPRWRVFRNS
jgi:hypothetical protein